MHYKFIGYLGLSGGEERVVGGGADDRDQCHMLWNDGSDLRIGLLRPCLPYDYLFLST